MLNWGPTNAQQMFNNVQQIQTNVQPDIVQLMFN